MYLQIHPQNKMLFITYAIIIRKGLVYLGIGRSEGEEGARNGVHQQCIFSPCIGSFTSINIFYYYVQNCLQDRTIQSHFIQSWTFTQLCASAWKAWQERGNYIPSFESSIRYRLVTLHGSEYQEKRLNVYEIIQYGVRQSIRHLVQMSLSNVDFRNFYGMCFAGFDLTIQMITYRPESVPGDH